jgi:hypothetical protein
MFYVYDLVTIKFLKIGQGVDFIFKDRSIYLLPLKTPCKAIPLNTRLPGMKPLPGDLRAGKTGG